MAVPREAHLHRVLGPDAFATVKKSKVFVCGAGGIGCELLKNLVLSGFDDIEVIDLDTIDASNLNRQFLFRPHHVGKSKAEVARESALAFNPGVKIHAMLGNVKDSKYDREFYQRFSIVLNGLDNRSARQHVNRMCMKAGVPLIESGTMGFNGQVQPIIKDLTACYDCNPKPAGRVSFAVCTIHQRPTSMVHCVHYAKEFYKRFFGEEVDKDPEMQYLDEVRASSGGDPAAWAPAVFDAMFDAKIRDMLSMKEAASWGEGKEPRPLPYPDALALADVEPGGAAEDGAAARIEAKRVLPPAELARRFTASLGALARREAAEGKVPFDKDDAVAMELVNAVANLRAWGFRIPLQSEFDVKTVAGNIVPAIATSNAVAAGFIVLEAMKVLTRRHDALREQYLYRNGQMYSKRQPDGKKGRWSCYLVPIKPQAPNPRCYVCQSGRSQLSLELNIAATTVRFVVANVAGNELSMASPMVSLCPRDGVEKVIYEDEEHEGFAACKLSKWIDPGDSRGWSLKVEDMLQELEAELVLTHNAALDPADYKLTGDREAVARAVAAGGAAAEDDDSGSSEVVAYHPTKRKRGGGAAAAEDADGGGARRAAAAAAMSVDDDDPPPPKRAGGAG